MSIVIQLPLFVKSFIEKKLFLFFDNIDRARVRTRDLYYAIFFQKLLQKKDKRVLTPLHACGILLARKEHVPDRSFDNHIKEGLL